MSKEIVPLKVEEIPEIEPLSSQQLYTPIVSKSLAKEVQNRLDGNVPLAFIGGAGLSLTTIVTGIIAGESLGIDLISVIGGIAGSILSCANLGTLFMDYVPGKKRRIKKYGHIRDYILEKNFQSFLNWAKARYNIIVDVNAMPESNLKQLKYALSGIQSFIDDFAWVKDTMGKTYLILQTNANEYYLTEEKINETHATIVLKEAKPLLLETKAEETFEPFTGETDSLWKALQSRLTVIENFGLSAENAHTVKRVQQDSQELITNIHKLAQLNGTIEQEKIQKILSELNQEIQNIIDQEIQTVNSNILNMSSWVESRNLPINAPQLLTLDNGDVLGEKHIQEKEIQNYG